MAGQCLSGQNLCGCGVQEGFAEKDGGELELAGSNRKGYFLSCIYDSGERGMQWNRLVLDIGRNLVIQVAVWLFDDRREGEKADLQENVERKCRYVADRAQYHSNYREMLLYGREQDSGRFARLAVEVFSEDKGGDRSFKGYALTFPKESFAAYLPALYQNKVQLERFLAVQQSIYMSLEEQIDRLAWKLDYEFCSGRQAVRLAKWMGWGELAEEVNDETLRRLLGTGTSLISRKGTCRYYTELTEILTDRKVLMVEEPEEGRAAVLVLERPEKEREGCLNWLRRNVPIGMDVAFIILDRTDRLNRWCFLDRTAALSEYESALVPGGVPVDGIVLL